MDDSLCHFLIMTHGTPESRKTMGRHPHGKARSLYQDPLPVHDAFGAQFQIMGKKSFIHHADSHGLTMDILSVPAQGFQRVTDGMSIIQNPTQTRFPFIFGHHSCLDLTTTRHDLLDVFLLHVENMFHPVF